MCDTSSGCTLHVHSLYVCFRSQSSHQSSPMSATRANPATQLLESESSERLRLEKDMKDLQVPHTLFWTETELWLDGFLRKSPHAWNIYFLPMHRQCSSSSSAWAVHKLCRLILNINVKDIVCVSERLQMFVSVCLECVCVCVCVCLCLLGSRLPVWADGLSISLKNRELMYSGSVCVFACQAKFDAMKKQMDSMEMEVMETRLIRASELNGEMDDDDTGEFVMSFPVLSEGITWRDWLSFEQSFERKLSQPSWIVLAELKGYLGGFPWVWRPMTLWWGGELQVCWAF